MNPIQNKIDFTVIFSVKNANPNGDPLNGNRPRQNFDGFGEVSDVCLKRKIRNRLQDLGKKIFVQSADRAEDGINNLFERAESIDGLKEILKANEKKSSGQADEFAHLASKEWIDVRSFGQVFAFAKNKLSVGVRGPVSIQLAESIDPITINSMQITKSVNSVPGEGKTSDTMGTKHFVDFGLYIFHGSINPQLAEKTGFSTEDAESIKEALRTLFENDASSARPEGTMAVEKLYWWEHPGKMGSHSAAKVHQSVKVHKKEGINQPRAVSDYEIRVEPLSNVEMTEIEGI